MPGTHQVPPMFDVFYLCGNSEARNGSTEKSNHWPRATEVINGEVGLEPRQYGGEDEGTRPFLGALPLALTLGCGSLFPQWPIWP